MTNSNDNQREGGNFVTVGEYLQIVIQFQIESAQFYHDLKGQTDRRDAFELLDILEKQEIKHQQILRDYKVQADPNSILQFPPTLTLAMPVLKSENPTFEELLALAIEREICAAVIYEKAAERVSGGFRDLLTGLAVFEREHEERLKSLQRYY